VVAHVDALLRRRTVQVTDGGDAISTDADVGAEPGRAGSVDHPAVLDDQIEALGCSGERQDDGEGQGGHRAGRTV
jgi:hypothetical protein